MTASEIMPVLVNASQSIVASLGNFEVFDGISALTIILGIFAIEVVGDFIVWLRGGRVDSVIAGSVLGLKQRTFEQNDWRHYH